MANALYPKFKTSLGVADTNVSLNVDTATDGPFIALLTATYTYSAAHQFASSLTGVVGTDQRITAPTFGTVADGVFDGADLTYTSVAAGSTITQLAGYRHNVGANTTWRLFLFLDTSVTGLPVATNGGNITITWNASGIFQL